MTVELKRVAELRCVGIFSCPHRIVTMYSFSSPGHPKDGRFFFCEFPSHWFEDFNTAEATKFYHAPKKEEPDIVWDGQKLKVI